MSAFDLRAVAIACCYRSEKLCGLQQNGAANVRIITSFESSWRDAVFTMNVAVFSWDSPSLLFAHVFASSLRWTVQQLCCLIGESARNTSDSRTDVIKGVINFAVLKNGMWLKKKTASFLCRILFPWWLLLLLSQKWSASKTAVCNVVQCTIKAGAVVVRILKSLKSFVWIKLTASVANDNRLAVYSDTYRSALCNETNMS